MFTTRAYVFLILLWLLATGLVIWSMATGCNLESRTDSTPVSLDSNISVVVNHPDSGIDFQPADQYLFIPVDMGGEGCSHG